MKSNQEIIKAIYDYRDKMEKFNFTPCQKLTDFKLLPSAADRYGVVIMKDEKVYRGIYPKSKDMFIRLYNTGILQTLMNEGFIPTFSVSDFYTDDYPLLIDVEKLYITHAQEYTYSMIKQEAKLKLRLLEILTEFGYTLIDGHTGNTTFKKGNPVFFDLGSFVQSSIRSGAADQEIWLYNIVPLIFLSCGKFMSARGIYYGFPNPWLAPYVAPKASKEVKDTINEFCKLFNVDNEQKEKLENFQPLTSDELDILFPMDNFATNTEEKSKYTYLQNFQNTSDDISIKIINKICDSYSNPTIMHIGCSTGWFLNQCVQSGKCKSMYGLDCNEFLLDYAVNHVQGADFIFCNAIIGGVISVPNVDVVYVSGMTYDVLANNKFDITTVLTRIKRYVSNSLYIEFFPHGKKQSSDETIPNWYSLEWFETHLAKFFNIVSKKTLETIEINGEQKPSRVLYETKIS